MSNRLTKGTRRTAAAPGNPGYDPNLKMAMLEMERICKRYDIGAALLLVSKTHSEYGYQLPPWGCASWETDPQSGQQALRFRSHHASYGSKEAQHAEQEDTAHFLFQLRDLGGQTFLLFEQVCRQLNAVLDIEHHPFSGHVSDDDAAL